MRIQLGSTFTYQMQQPTPMIMLLHVHHSRVADLERPDHLTTYPAVPITPYRDGFGNWCNRLVAPAGQFVVKTETVIQDSGERDQFDQAAWQSRVEDLPSEVLEYLLGSRYCETDRLSEFAWQNFGNTQPGYARVQAICDFVHNHITFGYQYSRATRTAAEALAEGVGVCRDYTHLAVALCRCMNIPTRYCTGYMSDIGEPLPHPPGDFAAWMEVFLSGRWHTFDPRNNTPRIGRILIATGRDASDVPLTHTFGPNTLSGFEVITEEIPG